MPGSYVNVGYSLLFQGCLLRRGLVLVPTGVFYVNANPFLILLQWDQYALVNTISRVIHAGYGAG